MNQIKIIGFQYLLNITNLSQRYNSRQIKAQEVRIATHIDGQEDGRDLDRASNQNFTRSA
jgi:hypothetical protein